ETNENELILKEKNEDEIKRIFEDLEFRSLLTRIFKQEATPTHTNKPIQGDLFASENIIENYHESIPEFSSELTDIQTTPHIYKIADTENKMTVLCNELLKHKSVCFDTETTGLDPLLSELVGLSFSFKEGEAYYVPISKNKDVAIRQVN